MTCATKLSAPSATLSLNSQRPHPLAHPCSRCPLLEEVTQSEPHTAGQCVQSHTQWPPRRRPVLIEQLCLLAWADCPSEAVRGHPALVVCPYHSTNCGTDSYKEESPEAALYKATRDIVLGGLTEEILNQ